MPAIKDFVVPLNRDFSYKFQVKLSSSGMDILMLDPEYNATLLEVAATGSTLLDLTDYRAKGEAWSDGVKLFDFYTIIDLAGNTVEIQIPRSVLTADLPPTADFDIVLLDPTDAAITGLSGVLKFRASITVVLDEETPTVLNGGDSVVTGQTQVYSGGGA